MIIDWSKRLNRPFKTYSKLSSSYPAFKFNTRPARNTQNISQIHLIPTDALCNSIIILKVVQIVHDVHETSYVIWEPGTRL